MQTSAARLAGPRGAVSIESISAGAPGPGEVLVGLEACGICHSDVFVAGLEKLPLTPLTLGHEGIGHVEAVGEGVESFREGDRVGITFLASTCGHCEYCTSGQERFCARQKNHGYTWHGALTGHAVVPAQQLIRVPGGLAAEIAAPLCCAGWTAFGGIREAGLDGGKTIALYGMGGLGHLALQYAQYQGLRVAAVDVAEEKLEHARRLGAEIVLQAEGSGRALQKQHGGAHAAVVFTPSPAAIREAFAGLRRNGTLVLVGLSTNTYELPIVDTVLKGIRIRGSFLGTRHDLEQVFQLAVAGVGIPEVQTHPLERTPELLDRLHDGRLLGRAVIVF